MNKIYYKNVVKDLNKKYILDKIVNSRFKFYKDNIKPDNKQITRLSDLILYLKYKNIPIPINIINEQDVVVSHLNLFNYLKYFSYKCLISYSKKRYKISNKIYNIPELYFNITINDKDYSIELITDSSYKKLNKDLLKEGVIDITGYTSTMYITEYIDFLLYFGGKL